MAGTTARARTNGRLITREDLQAAYAQVVGEGEASARAAAPVGWPSPAPSASSSSPWPSWPGGAEGAPPRPWSRSGGSEWTSSCGVSCGRGSVVGWPGTGTGSLLAGATFFLRRVLNDRSSVVSSVTISPGEQLLISVRDRHAVPADA